MMNYQVKFSIATYAIKNQKEDMAILGVYDMNNVFYREGSIEELIENLERNFDEEIILESSLGGGAGFPTISNATKIITKNHDEKLKKYISDIKENTIVMFTNQDRYGLILINLLASNAKKINKKIICIEIGKCKIEGKRMNSDFLNLWQNLEKICDETILINCNKYDDEMKKFSFSEIQSFLFNEFSTKLHGLITK